MQLPCFAQVVFNAHRKHMTFSKILPPLRITKQTELERQKKMCVHGKNKYICRACCGSSLCRHQKRRYLCTECRGPKRGYLKALQQFSY